MNYEVSLTRKVKETDLSAKRDVKTRPFLVDFFIIILYNMFKKGKDMFKNDEQC